MFEKYINGTLGELERRARVLRAKIPRDLPTYYATLVKSCNGVNPYDYLMEQHPADAARMSVLLIGLREIDYDEEAEEIARVWQSVIGSSSYKPPSDFRTCYPQDVLEKIAKQCLEGVKAIGCRIAHTECGDEIHTLLNEAWQRFWDNPSEYATWEDQRTRKLSKSRLA